MPKCATAHLYRGVRARIGDSGLSEGRSISELQSEDEVYRYLGVSQLFGARLVRTKVREKS